MDSLHSLAIPVSYLITALIAAGARFVVSKEAPTLGKVVSTIILSAAVVISLYPYLKEKEYSDGTLNLIISLLAFAARDILEAVIKLGAQVKKDPLTLLRDFLNRIRPADGDK